MCGASAFCDLWKKSRLHIYSSNHYPRKAKHVSRENKGGQREKVRALAEPRMSLTRGYVMHRKGLHVVRIQLCKCVNHPLASSLIRLGPGLELVLLTTNGFQIIIVIEKNYNNVVIKHFSGTSLPSPGNIFGHSHYSAVAERPISQRRTWHSDILPQSLLGKNCTWLMLQNPLGGDFLSKSLCVTGHLIIKL